jgi:hypothetical protein
MLAYLTDEHISHAVAEQVHRKRADIRIESVLRWRGGTLRQTPDDQVLDAAREAELTLVTYDQKTIPPILVEFAMSQRHHAGVLFVDRGAIASDNIGALVRALIACHDLHHDRDWTNVVMFLSPPRGA